MANRRRTARKLKRHVKKKLTQQQQKRDPQQDLMKLMAMMGPIRGGGASMDPATFLNTKEEIAKLQADNAKLKKENKAKVAEQKMKAQEYKNEADAVEQQQEVQKQEQKTAKAKQDLQHKRRMVVLQGQEQALQGEMAQQKAELDEAERDIQMNQGRLSLEETRRQAATLASTLSKAKMSADYSRLPQDVRDMHVAALNKATDVLDEINKFEEGLVNLNDKHVELEHLNKAVDEIKNLSTKLVEARQKVAFEQRQVNDKIARMTAMVDAHHKTENELAEERLNLARSHERAKTAGFIYDMDEYGHVRESQKDHQKIPEPDPDEDPDVKKEKEILDSMINVMRYIRRPHGVEWSDILEQGEQHPKWDEVRKLYHDKGRDYSNLKGRSVHLAHIGTIQKLTLEGLCSLYRQHKEKHERELERATKVYEDAVEHNKKIDALPETNMIEVTPDLLAAKANELDALRSKRKQIDQMNSIREGNAEEYIRTNHEIARLTAATKDADTLGPDAETYEKNAKLKHVVQDLERKYDMQTKETARRHVLEDETKELEHQKTIREAMIDESSDAKKAREDAMTEQIKARIKAEQEKEIADAKHMTYKYEQEARQAHLEDNARNSEEIRASREAVASARANHYATELRKEEREKVRQAERANEEAMAALRAMELVDDITKDVRGYTNIAAQLNESARRVKNMTTYMSQQQEQYEKDRDAVVDKVMNDPLTLLHVTKMHESKGMKMPQTPDEFKASLTPNSVASYHRMFNSPGFENRIWTNIGSTPPPRPKTPPPRGVYRSFAPPPPADADADADDADEEE